MNARSKQPSGASVRGVLRWVVGAALVTALVVVGAAGIQRLDHPVAVVRVAGDLSPAERRRVQDVVAAHLPSGIVSLDLAAVRESLLAESWIAEVRMWRSWPGAIGVKVRPAAVLARWRDGRLLSSRGAVIRPPAGAGRLDVPVLAGPDGSSQRVMAQYRRISERLRAHEIALQRLELSETGTWRFVTQDGLHVVVGREHVLERVERVAQITTARLAGRLKGVERVDARYANGVAVAWREAPRVATGGSASTARLSGAN